MEAADIRWREDRNLFSMSGELNLRKGSFRSFLRLFPADRMDEDHAQELIGRWRQGFLAVLLTARRLGSLYMQTRLQRSAREGTEMKRARWILGWALCAAAPALMLAQAGTAQKRAAEQTPAANASVPDEAQAVEIQRQLIQLLRTSPTLTSVVARDPSLLADQAYVTKNNPELEQFLEAHPDVARNPEFYLFSHLPGRGPRDAALERMIWPEMGPPRPDRQNVGDIVGPIAALLAFACFLIALVWLLRMFVESRRWGRAFKLQSEVHGRLIDKFSSNQELAAYMETEAGRRFLEAAPIPMGAEAGQRMPNAVARVLTPVQVGVVMVLLGIGLLLLRNAGPDTGVPMLVLGTVILMPGIGFILSAGIAWVLAGRLGLMPQPAGKHDGHFDSQDRL